MTPRGHAKATRFYMYCHGDGVAMHSNLDCALTIIWLNFIEMVLAHDFQAGFGGCPHTLDDPSRGVGGLLR